MHKQTKLFQEGWEQQIKGARQQKGEDYSKYCYIIINSCYIDLSKFYPKIKANINEDYNSYELSFYSIKEKIILSKLIQKQVVQSTYEDIYNKFKDPIESFKQDIEILLNLAKSEGKNKYIEKLYKIKNFYKDLAFPTVNLNKQKSKLEKEFSKDEYINFTFRKNASLL